MSLKTRVNNICAVGLLVRAADPSFIFVERKFKHPAKAVDGQLCPPGGNWFGEEANNDDGPAGTFVRELAGEEFSLRHEKKNTAALGQIDGSGVSGDYQTLEGTAVVTESDLQDLETIKAAIRENVRFFGAYVMETDGAYFLEADPTDERRGKNNLITLAYYYVVPLNEELWKSLEYLQQKFVNLSNESQTVLTNFDEIAAAQQAKTDPYDRFDFAWAHGWAMRDYLVEAGFKDAELLTPPKHTRARRLEDPKASYPEILSEFEVDKVPPKYTATTA